MSGQPDLSLYKRGGEPHARCKRRYHYARIRCYHRRTRSTSRANLRNAHRLHRLAGHDHRETTSLLDAGGHVGDREFQPAVGGGQLQLGGAAYPELSPEGLGDDQAPDTIDGNSWHEIANQRRERRSKRA